MEHIALVIVAAVAFPLGIAVGLRLASRRKRRLVREEQAARKREKDTLGL